MMEPEVFDFFMIMHIQQSLLFASAVFINIIKSAL